MQVRCLIKRLVGFYICVRRFFVIKSVTLQRFLYFTPESKNKSGNIAKAFNILITFSVMVRFVPLQTKSNLICMFVSEQIMGFLE